MPIELDLGTLHGGYDRNGSRQGFTFEFATWNLSSLARLLRMWKVALKPSSC